MIVNHILELAAQEFPPWLPDVAAMADSLRAEHSLGHVGVNWVSTFVKRQPELEQSQVGRRRGSKYAEPGSARAVYLEKHQKPASKCRSKQKQQRVAPCLRT